MESGLEQVRAFACSAHVAGRGTVPHLPLPQDPANLHHPASPQHASGVRQLGAGWKAVQVRGRGIGGIHDVSLEGGLPAGSHCGLQGKPKFGAAFRQASQAGFPHVELGVRYRCAAVFCRSRGLSAGLPLGGGGGPAAVVDQCEECCDGQVCACRYPSPFRRDRLFRGGLAHADHASSHLASAAARFRACTRDGGERNSRRMSTGSLLRSLDSLMVRLGIGRLGQNALLSTAGLGTRAIIQAGYLIVLSRWMGPHGYGLFAGSVAAAIIIALVSGWGIAYVVTQQVARDRTRSHALWATAILQVLLSGILLIGVLMVGSGLALVERVDIRSMVLLGFAELVALPLVQVATSLCLALDRGATAAVSMCLVPAFRLFSMIAAVAVGVSGTPDHVAFLHFAGSVAGMLVAIYLVHRVDGAPAWRERLPLPKATIEGTRYAVGSLVGTSYQEVDKVLLLQILGATVAGTYTAAFRVMSVF